MLGSSAPSRPGGATPPWGPVSPETARKAFFGAWAVAGVVLVAALVLAAGHPLPLAATYDASYIDSRVPTGANFTFILSESIALYVVNQTGGVPAQYVSVAIVGNWSATAPTSVSEDVNGATTACPAPWGCFGAPGNFSGTLHLTTLVSTTPASEFSSHTATISLVFWSSGGDHVTVDSPIYAVVTG